MITEIQKNFYRITLPMPYRLRHVHAYVLVQDGAIALFDSGMNMPGSYEKLEADLASIGLGTKSIRNVYITHSHTDHCSMAGILQKRTQAKIFLSAAADLAYQHLCLSDSLIPQANLFYSRHGMSRQQVDAIVEEINDIRGVIVEFQADGFLRNEEVRQFGDWKFKVIFTPGHAAGHICFFFPDQGFMLAGDHILPYIAPSLTPNIFDETFHALRSYLDSLQIVEQLPLEVIHPGHGTSLNGISERTAEIRTHHALKKQRVFDALIDLPKTTFAISAEINGQTANWEDWEKFMALNETYVYLQDLKSEGVIKEEMNGEVIVYTAN